MKKNGISLFAVLCLMAMSSTLMAQNGPIDFEAAGHGADWTWTVFENDWNPPVAIVDNPAPGGINTSSTVMEFTALVDGNPWAGCESQHGADIGMFSITAENCTISLMVYKPVTSNVGVKFAQPDGGAEVEILVANTLINEWEELVFDFSARIGNPESTDVDQIILFADFDLDGRTQDNVCYYDNITFSPQVIPEGPEEAAPTPTAWEGAVISLFSNAYDDVTVDTWSADWDIADVQDVQIEGDDVKLYTGLDHAGIEFTSQTIDAVDMTHFHMDIWTADPTDLPAVFQIKLVDFGANGVWDGGGDDVEHELIFDAESTPPLVTGSWVIFDLPLADFTNLVTREHLAQLIISGDPNTVYVDNIYFYDEALASVEDSYSEVPSVYILDQNYPNPFNPTTTIDFSLALPGHVSLNVYDIGGRLVKTLFEGESAASSYQVNWDGTDTSQISVASGIYFYQLAVDGETVDTRRMILMK